MKQILQNIQNGSQEIIDTPAPKVKAGTLLIGALHTVISPGTERMLQEFGQSNWLQRARQQPDKVRMVLDKLRTDGLGPTLEAVKSKLEQPLPLGYCNAGKVLAVGEGVDGFRVGDRVASNGHHAEVVRVPKNLCARIPDGVDDESAAFTVLGAIALQGIRLAQPTLGETVVVTGLGLVGLLTVQLLKAHGCRVLGIDYVPDRLELARQFGAEVVDPGRGEDPLAVAQAFSRGRGVDAVLITASTKSNEPVHLAAQMCRKRGRIVLVGVTGLDLSRADFYEKELSFQVSCSYGPGRYDAAYEELGQDYPVGFVRWTEQRNFEAVLDMMVDGRLDVRPLITHRFAFQRAVDAYELLSGEEHSLGILLEYPGQEAVKTQKCIVLEAPAESAKPVEGPVTVGFLGSGNYAGRVLIPAFKKAGATLHTVVSSGGVSAARFGRKYGFREASTDPESVLENPNINAVVIATRHDNHARYVCAALKKGKNVFVEKPLALTHVELEEIRIAYAQAGHGETPLLLMVGFNRRFAPQVLKMKYLLEAQSHPKSFIMTVNAGAIPSDHWTQDPKVGGGRIIGEACHFVDLLRFLADSPIVDHQAMFMMERTRGSQDTATINLSFEDGSIGSINYFANGNKQYPKEKLEVFCGGGVLQLDNFRKMRGLGWPGFRKMNLARQDKGNEAAVDHFVREVAIGPLGSNFLKEYFEVADMLIKIARC